MDEVRVLLVGPTSRREFAEARQVLERLSRVVAVPDIDAAVARLASDQFVPELIVLAQAFPGQYSAQAVQRLWQRAPLARLVALLGSWCEGEQRSGRPWPAGPRVFWHQWSPRCEQELAYLAEGSLGCWGLPPTASQEERLLAVAAEPMPARSGLVVICSDCFEMQDWLSVACSRAGYSTVGVRPGQCPRLQGVKAALFDADDGQTDSPETLRRLVAAVSPAPVLALVGFPRVEDRDRLLAAGAAAVLSKPLLLEDLFDRLEQGPPAGR